MNTPNWQHHSKKERKRHLKPQALRSAKERRRQLLNRLLSPAKRRGFCYNIGIEKKKISPMKNFLKVALGIIAYSQLRRDFGTPYPTVRKTGTRTNMARSEIPNNGGL